MKNAFLKLVVSTVLALVATMSAAPASAQLTGGANNNVIALNVILLGNDIAYDPVNNIYLSVAAYGNDMFAGAPKITGGGHSQRRRERGSGMTGAKGIVSAFGPIQETAGAARLPQLPEEFAAAPGQQFVGVGLIAGIPNDLVLGSIQQIVERHRQFHHPEV